MNRSILIVICDFLLVSMLAFSTVDINKVADEGTSAQLKTIIATNQVDSGKDLAAVMRLALEEEQKQRELLLGELTKTRETSTEQGKQLQIFQQQLQTTEQQRSSFQQQLQTTEQQRANFQQQLQTTEQQRANLQQLFASAQTNIDNLSRQVRASSTDASISKEKLAAMEAELKKRAEEAAAFQQQLAQLAKSNQVVLNEKQQLSGKLQLAEVEKRHATEQAARMQEQVKVEREEKAKLVEGVKTLASKSGELAQEIRENRPLAPNTIFNDLATNRVQASLTASRSGLLGGSTKSKQMETVLVASGTNIFALCHVQDTPLTITDPGTDWEVLTGTLARNDSHVPIRSLSFCWPDPRVLLIPVSPSEARQLGCKVYRISSDPYKFQDAVLVGAREGYYGECKFEIDLSTPEYVKLDRNLLKGLVGKFNPSRGDFVFSKSGEFLGVMANSTYCMMFQKLETSATLQLGPNVRDQHTGEVLGRLYSFVFQMPPKLQ